MDRSFANRVYLRGACGNRGVGNISPGDNPKSGYGIRRRRDFCCCRWTDGANVQTETMIVLAVINALYSLSQARTLLLAPGERVDWLSVSRAIGGIAAGLGSSV